jgi:hypothetical protein
MMSGTTPEPAMPTRERSLPQHAPMRHYVYDRRLLTQRIETRLAALPKRS